MCLCLFLKEKLLLHFSQTNVLFFLWWLFSFLAVSWISPQSLQINFSPPSPCTASMCLANDPADFKIWLQINITPLPSSSSPPLTTLIFFIVEPLESVSPYLFPLLGGILLLKYYLEIKIYLLRKSNHLHDQWWKMYYWNFL